MEKALLKAKQQQEAIAKMKADAIEKAKMDAGIRMQLAEQNQKAAAIAEAKKLLSKKL